MFSEKPLAVVAVYTAAGRCNWVNSIHTERVPERKIGTGSKCPDLIVETIERPEWNDSITIIKVTVKNIGLVSSGETVKVVLTEPSTNDPSTGMPYSRSKAVPSLDPEGTYNLAFTLPYWVYNPDVHIKVMVDVGNTVIECDEENNEKEFIEAG